MSLVLTQRKAAKPQEAEGTVQELISTLESKQPVIDYSDLAGVSIEVLADAYGELKDQTVALQAAVVFQRFKLVEAEMKKRLNEALDATDTADVSGTSWLLSVGACGKKPRQVTNAIKVAEFVDAETFASLITIKVSDVDKYLTPDEVAQVINPVVEHTTTRKITTSFIGES